jgi:agmatinase
MVGEIASVSSGCNRDRRVIPFIIGGDHSLMYGDVKGLTKVYGPQTFGVLHFDAHYDASADPSSSHTHGSPVRNLFEEGLVRGRDFIQIGLRGYAPSNKDLDWMIDNDFNFHTMAEVDRDGWDTVMDRVIAGAQGKPQFISFDIDVIDPAYTPGTGTPEPGGLTPREALPLVRRICAEVDVIGFELVELLPYRDPGYITVLNANRVVRECLTGIAMRRLGGKYREPYYRSPRSVPRRD